METPLPPYTKMLPPAKSRTRMVALTAGAAVAAVILTIGYVWLGGSDFAKQMLRRALDLSVHSTFATSYPRIVIDVAVLFYVLFRIGRRRGTEGVKLHWLENVRDAAVAVSVAFLLTFAYHLSITVPREIRLQAASNPAPEPLDDNHKLTAPPWPKIEPRAPTVTISPSAVTYNTGDVWSQTYTFRIQNDTRTDLYSVTFKLRVDSTKLSLKDFKFDVPKSSWKAIDENDPVSSKFGDILGLDCTDAKGRPVFLRFLLHLNPHESREVTLTYVSTTPDTRIVSSGPGRLPNKISAPNHVRPVSVEARVTHFEIKRIPRFSMGNMRVSPVFLDEKLSCGAMSFIVLKPD